MEDIIKNLSDNYEKGKQKEYYGYIYDIYGDKLLKQDLYNEILEKILATAPRNWHLNIVEFYFQIYEHIKNPQYLVTAIKYLPESQIRKAIMGNICDILHTFSENASENELLLLEMWQACIINEQVCNIFFEIMSPYMHLLSKLVFKNITKLEEKNKNLELEINHLKYIPDGPGYKQAKEEFEYFLK